MDASQRLICITATLDREPYGQGRGERRLFPHRAPDPARQKGLLLLLSSWGKRAREMKCLAQGHTRRLWHRQRLTTSHLGLVHQLNYKAVLFHYYSGDCRASGDYLEVFTQHPIHVDLAHATCYWTFCTSSCHGSVLALRPESLCTPSSLPRGARCTDLYPSLCHQ